VSSSQERVGDRSDETEVIKKHVEIDGLKSMPRLSLNMSGRNLGSRLGLSTPVGSNFGQTTVALICVWVYKVAQKCRTILCNFK